MQKILKAPTLIGIHRAVLEYSFENFTNLDKRKTAKQIKSTLPFCVDGAIRANYCLGFSDNLPYEKIGKNEPVCIAEEVPFDIPESWEWVILSFAFWLLRVRASASWCKSKLNTSCIPIR